MIVHAEQTWWVEGATRVIGLARKLIPKDETVPATRDGLRRLKAILVANRGKQGVWLLEEDCRKLLEWRQ